VGTIRRTVMGAVLLGSGFVVTGCPVATNLDNEERFEVLKDTAPPVNTSCEQELPALTPMGCDYQRVLRTYCATGGCHGSTFSGGLDLRLNTLLIARILEVPAKHRMTCSAGVPCVASEATCDECAMCPENALLVNRKSPADSWILKKLEPFVPGTTTSNVPTGCGDAMPSFLTSAPVRDYSERDKLCLVEFFTSVATSTPEPERFPCTLDGGA